MAHKETEETNSLHSKLSKLTLAEKVEAYKFLDGEIAKHEKELKEQLDLIPKK